MLCTNSSGQSVQLLITRPVFPIRPGDRSCAPLRKRSSRSAQGGIEGPTGEDRLQRGEERLALLAQRRQIAAQACEGVRAGFAAEAAGDLRIAGCVASVQ